MSPLTHRYLSLGDSFTIGTGIASDRSFPAQLIGRWHGLGLPVALTNPAVNGYTTDDLIAHELPLARATRPTVVTLLIGANDIVRGLDGDRYDAQVRRIVAGLAEAGVPADALYALPQPDWSVSPGAAGFGTAAALRARIERANASLREAAEGAGATYVDLWPLLRRQADAAMLAPDGLHPSAEAYAEWVDVLAGSIAISREG